MGRGIIDVPVRDVAEFVKDVQNNMSWDNFLIVSTLISIFYWQYCVQCYALTSHAMIGSPVLESAFTVR